LNVTQLVPKNCAAKICVIPKKMRNQNICTRHVYGWLEFCDGCVDAQTVRRDFVYATSDAAPRFVSTSLGCCAIWRRCWQDIIKGSVQGPRCEGADASVAIAKVNEHGVGVPTQAERNYVLVFAAVEQSDRCCYSQAVSHETFDMPTKMVVWVQMCQYTAACHELLHVATAHRPTSAVPVQEHSQWFSPICEISV
jgi:hypothetical protein